jgi:hypothetical protein
MKRIYFLCIAIFISVHTFCQITESNNNVGIGAGNTKEKIQVNGTGRFITDSKSGVNFLLKLGGGTASPNNAVGIGFDPEGWNDAYLNRIKTAIVVEGIGSWSRGKLHILQKNTGSEDSNSADLSNSVFTVDQIGNVGINNKNPEAKLDIYTSYNSNINKGIKMFYDGTWSTVDYSSNYRFIDISSTEGGDIFQVNGYGLGIGYAPPTHGSVDKLYVNGNVGIGTRFPKAKLSVNGTILATEIKVLVDINQYPDFVFADDYNLRPINEVEKYIKENKHLPEIPKADEVKDGLALGEMNNKLLQKVEELTLYIIEQNKRIDGLENKLEKNGIQ